MEKILVVDDEKINIMIVKKILGDEYEMHSAGSGEEALELAADIRPTIILLDIHMPGMSGYDTISRLKATRELADIPVIFLTADDDSNAEVKGFELGADDFIKKPFVSAVVKKRVAKCIDNFKLHCELQREVDKQTKEVEAKKEEVQNISVEVIQTLASAIDAKDIYTRGHSARVAEYSVLLAKELGWEQDRIIRLRYKALLHDVGKIGVPDRVLNKDGRLTDDEFALIKSHTTLGSDLLKGVSSLSDMYLVARNHHERYDGKGYPDGLSGNDISEEARLVGIADAYDAMSSDRVYRKALSPEIIRQELVNGNGKQFDPDMLEVFLTRFDNNRLVISSADDDINDNLSNVNISKYIKDVLTENNFVGAMKLNSEEMTQLYKYLSNLHARYGLDFNTVLITLNWNSKPLPEETEKAMKAMEYSIVQSLRKVDVVNRVSDCQFILILTEAHYENVNMIIERIFAGFYKNYQFSNVKPVYEVR